MKLCLAGSSLNENKSRRRPGDKEEKQERKREERRMEAVRTEENKQSGRLGVREEGNPDKKS